MMDIKQLFKTQGLKLAPYFICVIIYFVFVRNPNGELWTTLLKCSPIVCLMLYTLLQQFAKRITEDYIYSQLILLGLIFSCGGDILLNIDLFPYGMASFACAQICYIFAFGYKPFKWSIAVPLYVTGAAFVITVFKNLDEVLAIGLPIYGTLLLTMCWCSLARAVEDKCFLSTFRGVGGVLFVISDSLIGVDMFLIKVPNARIWIMLTYYAAQFAIALSQGNGATNRRCSKYLKGSNNKTH